MSKEKKYRELVELKGLIRQNKTTYQELANFLEIALSAFCNKINGFSVFNIVEVDKICRKLNISKNEIAIYFF